MKVDVRITPQEREILIDGEPMGKPYRDCLASFAIEHNNENDVSLFKPVFWVDAVDGKLSDVLDMNKRCEQCAYRKKELQWVRQPDDGQGGKLYRWKITAMVASLAALAMAVLAILRVLQ